MSKVFKFPNGTHGIGVENLQDSVDRFKSALLNHKDIHWLCSPFFAFMDWLGNKL